LNRPHVSDKAAIGDFSGIVTFTDTFKGLPERIFAPHGHATPASSPSRTSSTSRPIRPR
jgi:hypothetical protein